MKGVDDFEHELSSASSSEEKFKVLFKGMILNVFCLGLKNIDQWNLATLEIRCPEIYETIKDKEIRKLLVKIGMFNSVSKNSNKDALEIALSFQSYYDYLFDALATIGAYKFSDCFETAHGRIVSIKDSVNLYGRSEAVKVFLRALYILCKDILKEEKQGYQLDEKVYPKLEAWLELDKIEFVSHRERIEKAMRWLGHLWKNYGLGRIITLV